MSSKKDMKDVIGKVEDAMDAAKAREEKDGQIIGGTDMAVVRGKLTEAFNALKQADDYLDKDPAIEGKDAIANAEKEKVEKEDKGKPDKTAEPSDAPKDAPHPPSGSPEDVKYGHTTNAKGTVNTTPPV